MHHLNTHDEMRSIFMAVLSLNAEDTCHSNEQIHIFFFGYIKVDLLNAADTSKPLLFFCCSKILLLIIAELCIEWPGPV